MSEDRQERSDRLKRRFERDRDTDKSDVETEVVDGGTASQSSESERSQQPAAETSASNEAGNHGTSIKDRPSVLMYLPEELHTELDIRFDELNARYKREHGRPLEKNRDYYPAVVKASLEGIAVEDVLDV